MPLNRIPQAWNKIYILFFIIITIISLNIYKDFGNSADEGVQSQHLKINAKKIYTALNFQSYAPKSIKKSENLDTYPYKYYGVAAQYPLIILEYFPNIFDPHNPLYWEMKHLYVRIIYIIAGIFLLLTLKKLIKSNFIILLSLIIFFLHPRISAHSFYNVKDSIFLSLFTITSYFLFDNLKFISVKKLIVFAIFSAITVNSRMMGLLIPTFFIIHTIFHFKKNIFTALKILILYLTIFIITEYAIWPVLWDNPLKQFLNNFQEVSNYSSWKGKVIFNGNIINGTDIPYYYVPIWIVITTPLGHLLSWFIGFISSIYLIITKQIHHEKKLIIVFSLFVILVSYTSIIFFSSTLYADWRHLYYIFPSLINLGSIGLELFKNKIKYIYKITSLIIILSLLHTSYWMVINHPHHYVFFNTFAGNNWDEKWDRDFWRVSIKQLLIALMNDKNTKYDKKIIIYNHPYLNNNLNMINPEFKKNIDVVPTLEIAEYLIGDYKNILGDYNISYYKGYKEFINIEVDNKKIMTLFKRD